MHHVLLAGEIASLSNPCENTAGIVPAGTVLGASLPETLLKSGQSLESISNSHQGSGRDRYSEQAREVILI